MKYILLVITTVFYSCCVEPSNNCDEILYQRRIIVIDAIGGGHADKENDNRMIANLDSLYHNCGCDSLNSKDK